MVERGETRLKAAIRSALREIYRQRRTQEKFIPGKSKIQYASALYDDREVWSMLETIFDGWFGIGKRAARFEEEFAALLGLKGASITNSGSSANLLAVSALCSNFLKGGRRFKPGDEIITSSATFPTTVNPIFQNGLIPVFVDANPSTFNAEPEEIGRALSRRTRGIMLPHMLGIPNEMPEIMELANQHDLTVIEDTCDALGSRFGGRYLGTFGEISTFSFYAAHHISMGEGGALGSKNEDILTVARSIRDWGRALDVKDKEKRLRGKKLPEDYELRYVYTTLGYNLQPTEIQASKGLVQLSRLQAFVEARQRNYRKLRDGLSGYERYFQFAEPSASSDVSWFAFPITVRPGAPFLRKDIRAWLERHRIETRQMLAGNIIDHPAYEDLKFRVPRPLRGSELIAKNSFFFGLHPGLKDEHTTYIIDTFAKFMRQHST